MYWPDISQGWQEAHNSFGVTDAGLRWGVADGRIGGPRAYQTYVLLANPNPAPAEVRVRFLKNGVATVRNYTLNPTSRLNIWVNNDVPELGDGNFSADIQVLNYQPIAVEKALYWNAGRRGVGRRHQRHGHAAAAAVRANVRKRTSDASDALLMRLSVIAALTFRVCLPATRVPSFASSAVISGFPSKPLGPREDFMRRAITLVVILAVVSVFAARRRGAGTTRID